MIQTMQKGCVILRWCGESINSVGTEQFVILSEAKNLLIVAANYYQILRFAQNDRLLLLRLIQVRTQNSAGDFSSGGVYAIVVHASWHRGGAR